MLRIARSLIRQANAADPVIDEWSLGGGTALMLQIRHRESRDIDIFLSDPQQLSFLDPAKRDFDFERAPSGYIGDGAAFLKLAFANLGEIDFIVAPALTPNPTIRSAIDGETIALESVPEIITKKIRHRGSQIKPRDVFDIAAAGEIQRDQVIGALRGYRDAVSATIVAMERLNPDFVNRTILELAIEPAFAHVATTAVDRAKEILRAV